MLLCLGLLHARSIESSQLESWLAPAATVNYRDRMSTPHETLTLKVSGMTCQGCARSVENVVKKTPGVETAKVDLQAAVLTVTGRVDANAVRRAVEAAGYHVES
jgi:copper chaperone CopZ